MNRGHYSNLMCKICGEDIAHPNNKELETQICRKCRIVAHDRLKIELQRQANIKIRERLR